MSVLLTGSSQGIGKATAELFLSKGYKVYGLDILESHIEHSNYHHIVCDVSDINTLPDISDIEYVINNAGVLYPEDDPIKVNVYGAFNVEEKYIKTNLDTLKAVVNAGSIAVYDGQDSREYDCSKGALHAYTAYLCNELGRFGIRVNNIAPGSGETELNIDYTSDKDVYEAIARENILGRWGTPEESAKAVYFLCVHATFTTGATLFVDGGELVKTRHVRYQGEVRPYDKFFDQRK